MIFCRSNWANSTTHELRRVFKNLQQRPYSHSQNKSANFKMLYTNDYSLTLEIVTAKWINSTNII